MINQCDDQCWRGRREIIMPGSGFAKMKTAVDEERFSGDLCRAFQHPHRHLRNVIWRRSFFQRYRLCIVRFEFGVILLAETRRVPASVYQTGTHGINPDLRPQGARQRQRHCIERTLGRDVCG